MQGADGGDNEKSPKGSLGELARVFLKLGTIAFGGPAAHIAMMQDEVVRRRKWLDQQRFLGLLGATNLIPGPNSTELAIHIGMVRAGWKGLMIAGSCFILPAMTIVWAVAWLYVRYGTLPEVTWLLYGVKPVIIAIVLQALWGLGKTAVKGSLTGVVGTGVFVSSFLGFNEIALLFVAGFIVMGFQIIRSRWKPRWLAVLGLSVSGIPHAAVANSYSVVSVPVSLTGITLFFLKIGSVLFGSGYVLLVFLRADLVERWQWLTDQQLLDAIAIGQFTPGPVFTTATFIGYVIGRTPGAVLATVAIFLPAFLFVMASNPLIPRMRRSPWVSGFLDGVNVASLALVAAFLGFAYKTNAAWLVLGGGLIGYAYKML